MKFKLLLELLTTSEKARSALAKSERDLSLKFGKFIEERTIYDLGDVVDYSDIEKIVKDNGFVIKDFSAGIAYKPDRPNNLFKIGGILSKAGADTKTIEKFNKRSRTGSDKSGYWMVISHNPDDIAGMSTDKKWSSCMRLRPNKIHPRGPGEYHETVFKEIRAGGMVAYMISKEYDNIKDEEEWIDNADARIAIKRFVNDEGYIFVQEEKCYHEDSFTSFKKFQNRLEDELMDSNETTGVQGKYTMASKSSYSDTLSSEYEYEDKYTRMFKRAIKNNDAETIERLLKGGLVNPSIDGNWAIQWAALNGHLDIVKLLLADKRVDPTANSNWAIQRASMNGHFEIVKLLLTDPRVDPSDYRNYAIFLASEHGHTEVVRLLLADKRVDPSASDNVALVWAAKNGHTEVVRLLLADKRVDHSVGNNVPIQLAAENGHTEVVRLLLAVHRVDPSDGNNYALRWAIKNGHTEVVRLLLSDKRVTSELSPEDLNKYREMVKQ